MFLLFFVPMTLISHFGDKIPYQIEYFEGRMLDNLYG